MGILFDVSKLKTIHELDIKIKGQEQPKDDEEYKVELEEDDDIEELSVEEMRLFDGDIDESLGERPLSESDKLLDRLYRIFGDTAIYMG